MGLRKRQRLFCAEIASGTKPAWRAALMVGCANKQAARLYAWRNLRNQEVIAEIERLEAESIGKQMGEAMQALCGEDGTAAGAEILRFLTSVMRGEVRDGDLYGESKPPKVSERTKAAELLGRSQRLFCEQEKHDGEEQIVRIWGEDDLD